MILDMHFPLHRTSKAPTPDPANFLPHEWQEWNLDDVESGAPAHLPQSTWTYKEEWILEQNWVSARKEESGQRLQESYRKCVTLLQNIIFGTKRKYKEKRPPYS